MDSSEARAAMQEFLRQRANRGFGDVQQVSDRARQPFSVASMRGADNLLSKALRSLESGDETRAAGLIRRACELPFDEHEQSYPAPVAAHMLLFMAVTDALEVHPEGDSAWLDAALDVLSSASPEARCELRDVLTSIDHDYLLDDPERRALRRSQQAIPPRPEAWNLRYPPEQQREMVTEVLEATAAYRRAMGHRTEG